MTETTLTISSKNYSSWSLRGWLLCRMAGLKFVEEVVPVDDPTNRAELLLLSPSILVPCLTHQGSPTGFTARHTTRQRVAGVRGHQDLGYSGDRRVSQRDAAKGGAFAHRSGDARTLSLDLRGNALGIHQSAIGTTDEPESPAPWLQGVGGRAGRHKPHHHDLARVLRGLPWPLPVREFNHG